MPFRLRLGKRSQQYNVSNKDLYVISIELLTKDCIECTLCSSSLGQECLSNVCQKLQLQQLEFFGLQFKSRRGFHQWVDLLKPLKKQLDKHGSEMKLYFRLLYFVPNVQMLWDEMTRYHYFLQMKNFIIDGRLICNRDEAILLASFSLQAEFGDFNPERHTREYLVNFALLPRAMISNCSKEVQDMLMDFVINAYRNLQGVPSNVAEIYYISESQQLDGFGVNEGFPAKDQDSGSDVLIGVSLRGIFVIHLESQSNEQFLWTDIANLIHQKKVFIIERNSDGSRKNYLTFDNDYARCLWRTCVEQHQYFMKSMRNSDVDVVNEEQQILIADKSSSPFRNSVPSTISTTSQNELTVNNQIDGNQQIISLPHQSHHQSIDNNLTNGIQLNFHKSESTSNVPNLSSNLSSSNLSSSNLSANNSTVNSMTNIPQIYPLDNPQQQQIQLGRARSSTDGIDLNQIQISFPNLNDNIINSNQNESPIHSIHSIHSIHKNNQENNFSSGNITTVQVHQQPAWAIGDHQKQHCEADILTYDQRKALLPPYRSPPDYDTFMRQKYGHLSVSMNSIPTCFQTNNLISPSTIYKNGFVVSASSPSPSSSSNPSSQVPQLNSNFQIQKPFSHYKNYTDLSNLEIGNEQTANQTGNHVVHSIVGQTVPVLQAKSKMMNQHPLPLTTQWATEAITCSTPELNSIINNSNTNKYDLSQQQLLNPIAASIHKSPPPYYFNSVPDLSGSIMLFAQNNHLNSIQNSNPNYQLVRTIKPPSGSEPNLPKIPLMTAYSTPVNYHLPAKLDPTHFKHLSVDALNKIQSQNNNKNNELPEVKQANASQQPHHSVYKISHQQVAANVNQVATNVNQVAANVNQVSSTKVKPTSSSSSTNSINHGIENLSLTQSNSKSDQSIQPQINLKNKLAENESQLNLKSKDHRVVYLQTKLNDPNFMRDFDLLPRMNPTAKFTTALLNENFYRNRFRDILPYEDNRVKITPSKDNKSGYINASHVVMHLGKLKHRYIAAQGPLPNTTSDFWQMNWEQNVNLIVMVTNFTESGQEKCFPYLPLSSESGNNCLKFGDYEVTCTFSSVSLTYVTSSLIVTYNGQKRIINHLRFTEWSDHSCPDDVQGFLSFLLEIDSLHRRSSREGSGFGRKNKVQELAPIVVHCSAGVGRSGAVILCDSLLKFLDYNSTDQLDIAKALTQLRFQRMLSVQHAGQFRFIYDVLLQYLTNSRLI